MRQIARVTMFLGIAVLAVALALSAPPVLGNTITVDDAGCTLADAIDNANNDNDGGGDDSGL